MELRHIRTCLVLAEELHFGRTATRLRLAQSAISQTIKVLEEDVGARLFARTKRQVALTEAGRRFVERAKEVIRGVERATAEARQVAAGDSGRLMLRFTLMSALTRLPRVVARFQRQHPHVQLHIEPGGTVDQLEALRAGRCDLGFMSLKKNLEPLATEVVEHSALVALLPSRHPLARRRAIKLEDLATEKMVFLKQASEPQVHGYFRRRCNEAGFEPNIVVEVEQVDVLLALVAAGVGVSCVPGFVRRLRFPGAVTVPLRPAVPAGISVVWDPTKLPPAGHRFLALLRADGSPGAALT